MSEGRGYTVIVNESKDPAQPSFLGVTLIVANCIAGVLFTVVNAGIFPVPDADVNPSVVLSLIQSNVVPAKLAVKGGIFAMLL
jgi:hypothetical protein